jgi:Zn-dependent protease/CBS domain-containing protein
MAPRTSENPPPAVARRQAPSEAEGPFTGLRLGRIFGIEIFIDWSLAIIFSLVAVGLGAGALPRWHPEWSALLRWAVAFVAAAAFFGSILVHELSHAIVGRAVGVHVPRITLFVFGGMAHMHGEPSTPKAELLMAAVGPLTSVVIGVLASFIGVQLSVLGGGPTGNPEELIRHAGPIATVLLWLGPLNVLLAAFNLVPGFPLDGGRLLRALLWWGTGDFDKATRWASGAGRGVGWGLMTIGLLMAFGFRVPFFGTGFGSGLWVALIGWFLNHAARASYAMIRVRARLSHVPVREVMRSSLDTVIPEMSLAELVRDHIMKSDQTSFPVLEGSDLVGVVSVRDIQLVQSEHWPAVTVRQIMMPATDIPKIDVDADASKALECLAERDLEQLPVVDHGQLSGFVRRQDILKWLSLQPAV